MEHKEKKINCAVKKILKPSQREIEQGKTLNADWKNVIPILATPKSPYIVQTYDAFEDKNYAYIVMEYCEKGDLGYELSQRQKAGLPFTESVPFSSKIPFCIPYNFVPVF
jgi:serine/threonine protein kinase